MYWKIHVCKFEYNLDEIAQFNKFVLLKIIIGGLDTQEVITKNVCLMYWKIYVCKFEYNLDEIAQFNQFHTYENHPWGIDKQEVITKKLGSEFSVVCQDY
jgi:hypothetical protein